MLWNLTLFHFLWKGPPKKSPGREFICLWMIPSSSVRCIILHTPGSSIDALFFCLVSLRAGDSAVIIIINNDNSDSSNNSNNK